MIIRLVGPGGAGKTTIGSLLAQRLGVPFIDLDERFHASVGDISHWIDVRGYHAYAAKNVALYALTMAGVAGGECVLALSSGFMTYPDDVHPEYAHFRREIATSPSTFVLLPSLEVEACVAEVVRRQLGRPFHRSAEREEEVIRARFAVYRDLPATKVETGRAEEEVVEEMATGTAGRSASGK